MGRVMGLISLLSTSPLLFALIAVILIAAITVHEFAHAWMADHLGDPTPRSQGRVTLNPKAHLDPIGTLMIFMIGFGWGKPVMFDPFNLKNPTKEAALIAFAGPAANLLLALVLSVVLPLGIGFGISEPVLSTILLYSIFYNIMLAVFNLVPIHPLDGGKIAVALLPAELALEYDDFMRRYGTFVLIALILPLVNGTSAVSTLISPVITFISSWYLQLATFVIGLI